MPMLSTNRGHIDEERVKTIVIRVLESLGRNEKSIWEYYNEMAAVEDNIREVEWRDLADTILVFDGLFAAFLSAFLVFTIPQLQPNSTDIAMDVLIHISQQLSNSTTPAFAPTEFTASPNTVVVNLLFFLSLALVLIDAFLAMLVKSWLQEFDRSWRQYTVADLRAQERERRLQGLERWRLAELVTLLPVFIQSSLLFFCIGLIVLLFPLHLISAILSSVALVAGFGFYAFTTCVSVRDVYAPFSSPVSRGLVSLMDILRKFWREGTPLSVQRIIPVISSPAVGPDPPHAHQAGADPSQETMQSLAVNNGVASPSSLPQGDKGIKKREVVTHSRHQIDPQTHFDVFERLVTTTAEAMENIPVFLELLDQPVKDPTLWLPNVEKWKKLLHITLGLLGDPSTVSDSVARTIARNVMFCCDGGTADGQLSRRLISLFGHIGSGQIETRKPLKYLFVGYLGYYTGAGAKFAGDLFATIASLAPSDVADAELLWMVNTIPRHMIWKRRLDIYHESFRLLAAVLTYVSSTEQSRRSQVPLTAAVIHAMHTIKSAFDNQAIDSILGHDILPQTVLTTSDSTSMTFHPVDALDLWSGQCVGLASALLRPHTHWSGTSADNVRMFQLPLIAALYIDSTRQAGHASTTLSNLLKLPNITGITMSSWVWAGAYDYMKLAGYLCMVLFHEPLYDDGTGNHPFKDIVQVISQIIKNFSEVSLSALYLLEASVEHHAAESSLNGIRRFGGLYLCYDNVDRYIGTGECLNAWVLFHLETLFAQRIIIETEEFEQLDWTDTPEQVHIAKARLALYDSFKGEEHKGNKKLRLDPQVLKMFLWSKDYAVCTGAFMWCLHLVALSRSNAVGMFIPETVGSGWIEHLIQVLWGILDVKGPDHATSSLNISFPNGPRYRLPGMPELHAYQSIPERLRVGGFNWESHQVQGFLLFLAAVVELIRAGLTWDQVISIETWLAHLPAILENQDAHAQLETILANRKQELVEEVVIGLFAELPMADSGMDE